MEWISCTLKSDTGRFTVPYSTGYQTYSGLLSLIGKTDTQLADEVHDTSFASLTNSGLLGSFDWETNREYRKAIDADSEYELRVGVTHPDDEAVFNALIKALVINDSSLELADGSLRMTSVETKTQTHTEVLSDAADSIKDGASGVEIQFETPTCCNRYGDVWEAHPDRINLFQSLADRWNATTTEEQQMALEDGALGKDLFTVADTKQYETHSIVVHRREPKQADSNTGDGNAATIDGGTHLNEAQGFTGKWEYRFKGASEAMKTAVIALAKFAEFAGVGHHTARGAGTVSATVIS